jgi:hypothetical protein
MYQMAQARQAELRRETEEYRRPSLTVRMRIRTRLPPFPTASRRSRAGVVGPSTPGPVKINLLKRALGCGKSHDRRSIQSALVSTLEVPAAGPNQLFNEYDTERPTLAATRNNRKRGGPRKPDTLTVDRDQEALGS